MKAYRNIRLTAAPDVADIHAEGRKTSVGRIPRGEKQCPRFKDSIVRYADGTPGRDLNAGKVVRNDRGYCNPKGKAATRRYLKRINRVAEARFNAAAEGGND